MKTSSTPLTLDRHLPLGLFHWLLALRFAGAYPSSESEALLIHGKKPVARSEGIRNPRRAVAVVLPAAVPGCWTVQWRAAPGNAIGAQAELQRHALKHARD